MRQLLSDPGGLLSAPGEAPAHLVIDEVHERSLDTDTVLAALKYRLLEASAASTRSEAPLLSGVFPKVILMSATPDVEALTAYFKGDRSAAGGLTTRVGPSIGSVSVPGRAFPVAALYLEDAVADALGSGHLPSPLPGTGSQEDRREKPLPAAPALTPRAQAELEASEAVAAHARAAEDGSSVSAMQLRLLAEERDKRRRVCASLSSGAAGSGAATGAWVTEWLSALGVQGLATDLAARVATGAGGTSAADPPLLSASGALAAVRFLRSMDLNKPSVSLIEVLVRTHHQQADETKGGAHGAVLVFLPGVAEIEAIASRLDARLEARPDGGLVVSKLHAQVGNAEQAKAFAPAPRHCTR